MPKEMIVYLVVCFSIVGILNYIYLQQYNHLMAYMEKYYPELYEQVRQKPDVAEIGYFKGYKRIDPLIKLSKSVHTFNDSRLEKILSDFIQFDKYFIIISSVIIALIMIVGLILGIYLQQN